MDLDLIHHRHHGCLGKQALEVLGHEVADADRAHLVVGEQLLQRPVGVEGQVELRRHRLMEQQQVDLFDAQLAGAFVERMERGLVAVVADPDLRLDEHLFAGDVGLADALSDLALVGVGGGGVDVAIAKA